MFTQAGYNWRRRSICRALVMRFGRRWRRAAALVRFYDADTKRYTDFAWDGGADRFSWGEQLVICNLIPGPDCDWPADWPRSRLPA